MRISTRSAHPGRSNPSCSQIDLNGGASSTPPGGGDREVVTLPGDARGDRTHPDHAAPSLEPPPPRTG